MRKKNQKLKKIQKTKIKGSKHNKKPFKKIGFNMVCVNKLQLLKKLNAKIYLKKKMCGKKINK